MQRLFQKILVPIDYEDDNANMYRYALDMAQATKSEIILFHVYGLSRSEIKEPEARDEAGLWSLDLLKDFRSEHTPTEYSDVKVTLMTEPGLTVSSIQAMIDDEEIDLIIMGTHGHYSAVEAFFGSITMSLVNSVNVPIMAVPSDATYHQITRILYTINFEFHEIKIVEKLLKLSSTLEAQLICLHILEDDEHIQDIEENIEILKSIYEHHRKYREMISFDVRVGSVKDTIAYYAEDEDIHLVITRLKNPGWKIQTIESTSGQLIRKIDRPILVWKD